MDREDAKSHGVTETEVLVRILGPDGLTTDRRADVFRAIKLREAMIKDVPLELRVLYHAGYSELLAGNEDVWLKVGIEAGWPVRTAKDRAWRRAHPRGKETEPPDPAVLGRIADTSIGGAAEGEISD